MKVIITNSIFFFVFLSFCSLNAQNSGNSLYDNNVVHEIKFEFEEANFQQILDNNFLNNFGPELDVPYLQANIIIDGEMVDSVGVRHKGFTSYSPGGLKNPIKVDINEFVKGKRYDGLRKFNLNTGFGDPSMQRDVMCYKILRDMGVKAPRTSYAKVYFNDEYKGIYILIEQVDKEFLDNNFVDNDGNLFKNLGWSKFEWLGDDKDSYKQTFDLKTNEEIDDWSGFVNLMSEVNNSSDADFENEFEDIFNVELFLKTLAVDVATNNWDSYLEHGRNYYIYEDSTTNRFNWIPWDYNFALGGTFDFEGPGPDDCQNFPYFYTLTNGTGTVEFFEDAFGLVEPSTYHWDFGDGNSSTERNPVHTYSDTEPYGVTLTIDKDSTCQESISMQVIPSWDMRSCESLDINNAPSINEAFLILMSFSPECCDDWSTDCQDFYDTFSDGPGGSGSGGNFSINQKENEGVLIRRLLNVPKFEEYYYKQFCDLLENVMTEDKLFTQIDQHFDLINDAVVEDDNFLYDYDRYLEDFGMTGSQGSVKNYFKRRIDSLRIELDAIYTCASANADIAFKDLVINEFVASNDSIGGIADPNGGYPDWIELYNTSTSELDLTNVYLTDDKEELRKWQFPDGTTIPSDDYLIVWADNDEEQMGIHANFKLSKGGEDIYLSNADGSIIDSLTYGEQQTNIAYARIPNGVGDHQFWTTTIGESNDLGISSTDEQNWNYNLSLFPNPVSQELNVNIGGASEDYYIVSLYDIQGQEVISKTYSDFNFKIDVSSYTQGTYLLRIITADGQEVSKNVQIIR